MNPSTINEPFNLEDFLNISLGHGEDDAMASNAVESTSTQPHTTFAWSSFSGDSLEQPFHGNAYHDSACATPIISFDGASLLPEDDYSDPFSEGSFHQSRPNTPTRHLVDDEEFKRKLMLRRQKLDHLARRLSSKDQMDDSTACNSPALPKSELWASMATETPLDCKNSEHWSFDRTPLQAYSLFAPTVYLQKVEETPLALHAADLATYVPSWGCADPTDLTASDKPSKQSAPLSVQEREMCSKLLPDFIQFGLL
ncbi:hypothetical protein HDV03_002628 [Kappamyces sp. JEL0829]|nr:hypothetical protein HDV03_002628 [Kappamyces sp. JEL0829]